MADFSFYYGTMGAGKTKRLINTYYRLRRQDMYSWVLTALPDAPYSAFIRSRDGREIQATHLPKPWQHKDLFDLYHRGNWGSCQIKHVLIDEAQFMTLEQVRFFGLIADTHNVPVSCFGLLKDYHNAIFEGSQALLGYASRIVEVKSKCFCGAGAAHNMLTRDGKAVYEGEQVQLNNANLNGEYYAVCRKHWRRGVYQ